MKHQSSLRKSYERSHSPPPPPPPPLPIFSNHEKIPSSTRMNSSSPFASLPPPPLPASSSTKTIGKSKNSSSVSFNLRQSFPPANSSSSSTTPTAALPRPRHSSPPLHNPNNPSTRTGRNPPISGSRGGGGGGGEEISFRSRKISLLDVLRGNTGIISTQQHNNNNNDHLNRDLGDRLTAVTKEIHYIGKIPEIIALKIKKLFLSSNLLMSLTALEQFKNVETLSLANNQLSYYEDLIPLKTLECLTSLTLQGNLICNLPYYYDYILYLCPHLLFFDDSYLPSYSSLKRQQLFIQVKLNYQKLTNFLSKAIYNEMRNSFVFNLIQKRLLHVELIPKIWNDHFRMSSNAEYFIRQPLSTILRLLRTGGVFNYLISSNERFFSKSVQKKLSSISLRFSHAKSTNYGKKEKPKAMEEESDFMEVTREKDEQIFQRLLSEQEMDWMKDCLEKHHEFRNNVVDELELTVKQSVVKEIIEEIEKAFFYAPQLDDAIKGEESTRQHENSKSIQPPSLSSLRKSVDLNAKAILRPTPSSTTIQRVRFQEDDQIEEEKVRKVIIPDQEPNRRQFLGERYMEILQNPSNLAKDKMKHDSAKVVQPKSVTLSHAREWTNGQSGHQSMALTSDLLPVQQTEPDSETSEEADIKESVAFPSKSRPDNSTTSYALRNSFETQEIQQSLTKQSTINNYTTKKTEKSIQMTDPLTQMNSTTIRDGLNARSLVSEQKSFRPIIEHGQDFYAYNSLNDDVIVDFINETKQNISSIHNLFTENELIQELEIEYERSYSSLQKYEVQRKMKNHLFVIENAFPEVDPASITKMADLNACLRRYKENCGELFMKEKQIKEYNDELFLVMTKNASVLENICLKAEDYISRCRQQFDHITQSYQYALKWKVHLDSLEAIEIDRRYKIENLRSNNQKMKEELEESMTKKKNELNFIIKLNSNSTSVNNLLMVLKKELKEFNRMGSINKKLSQFYGQYLCRKVYRAWKYEFIISKKKLECASMQVIKMMKERKLPNYFHLWKEKYFKEQKIHRHIRYHHFKKKKFHFLKWSLFQMKQKRQNLLVSEYQKETFKRIKFRSFTRKLVLSRMETQEHFQSQLYVDLFVLVNTWKKWKSRFLNKLVHYKIFSTRIVLRRLRNIFSVWKKLQGFRIQDRERKVKAFIRERHRKYFISHYYQKWFQYLCYEREIFHLYRLKKNFFKFYKRIYAIRLRNKQLISYRNPFLKDFRSITQSYNGATEGHEALWSNLTRTLLYLKRWKIYFLKRKEKIAKYSKLKLLPTSGTNMPVSSFFKIANRFDHIFMRNVFKRFIGQILFLKRKQCYFYELYRKLRKKVNSRLMYHGFFFWKNSYYLAFLERLNQQNLFLKNTRFLTEASQSASFLLESHRAGLLKNDLETEISPEENQEISPQVTETPFKNPTTLMEKKPLSDLSTLKYFLAWKAETINRRRLKHIGKLVYRKRKLSLLSRYFNFMHNSMMKSCYQKYKELKKDQTRLNEDISSFIQDSKVFTEETEDSRKQLREQVEDLEGLKVHLASLEDELDNFSLHLHDNERSITALEREKNKYLERVMENTKEISVMKVIANRENEIGSQDSRRNKSLLLEKPFELPQINELNNLQLFFQKLKKDLVSNQENSQGRNDQELLPFDANSNTYFQSISERMNTFYRKQVEHQQAKSNEIIQQINEVKEALKKVVEENEEIERQRKEQELKHEQLLHSRRSLQALFTESEKLLARNSTQLLAEMKKFEDELVALQTEKKELTRVIVTLKDKEKSLREYIEKIAQKKKESLTKKSLTISKESIAREVDSLITYNPLTDNRFIKEKLAEFNSEQLNKESQNKSILTTSHASIIATSTPLSHSRSKSSQKKGESSIESIDSISPIKTRNNSNMNSSNPNETVAALLQKYSKSFSQEMTPNSKAAFIEKDKDDESSKSNQSSQNNSLGNKDSQNTSPTSVSSEIVIEEDPFLLHEIETIKNRVKNNLSAFHEGIEVFGSEETQPWQRNSALFQDEVEEL